MSLIYRALPVIALLLTAPACRRAEPIGSDNGPIRPSREPRSGCSWEEWKAPHLGVRLLHEKCSQDSTELAEVSNTIEIRPTGQPRGTVIIEVFAKLPAQTLDAAIRERFLTRLNDDGRAGCKVESPSHRAPRWPLEIKSYELAPTQPYAERLKQTGANTAQPCGDHGAQAQLTFFLGQMGVAHRMVYVHAGEQPQGWDPHSVRMLPDEEIEAALESLNVTDLVMAELVAGPIDARLPGMTKKDGRWSEGDAASTFTAFSRDGKLQAIVEQTDLGDSGNTSFRYYFRDGKLFFVRGSELRTPKKGNDARQDIILKRVAYREKDQVLEARQVVNGVSSALPNGDAASLAAHVAALRKRL